MTMEQKINFNQKLKRNNFSTEEMKQIATALGEPERKAKKNAATDLSTTF